MSHKKAQNAQMMNVAKRAVSTVFSFVLLLPFCGYIRGLCG
jgi:hypothetical protein